MSPLSANFHPTLDSQALEITAQEQRTRIHESISELRNQMHDTLNVRQRVRDYLLPASAAVAGLGIMLGFGIAGIFQPGAPRGRRYY